MPVSQGNATHTTKPSSSKSKGSSSTKNGGFSNSKNGAASGSKHGGLSSTKHGGFSHTSSNDGGFSDSKNGRPLVSGSASYRGERFADNRVVGRVGAGSSTVLPPHSPSLLKDRGYMAEEGWLFDVRDDPWHFIGQVFDDNNTPFWGIHDIVPSYMT